MCHHTLLFVQGWGSNAKYAKHYTTNYTFSSWENSYYPTPRRDAAFNTSVIPNFLLRHQRIARPHPLIPTVWAPGCLHSLLPQETHKESGGPLQGGKDRDRTRAQSGREARPESRYLCLTFPRASVLPGLGRDRRATTVW